MYDHTRQVLGQAGYQQYEISNWARPGRESRHNLTYWRDGTWLGVGAGAASSFRGRRWKNTPVLERYISSVEATGRAARVEDEAPDLATRLLDHVTLGLRLREGVSLDAFVTRFGVPLLEVVGEASGWLLKERFVELEGGQLRIAEAHQLVTNEILVRLEQALVDYVRRETSASQMAIR
jgi:oxygen-independent coproporphyrinogen-3 oxidase